MVYNAQLATAGPTVEQCGVVAGPPRSLVRLRATAVLYSGEFARAIPWMPRGSRGFRGRVKRRATGSPPSPPPFAINTRRRVTLLFILSPRSLRQRRASI